MKRFYITTPIYYVNDVPHIGHAYTTIAADVLSRWERLKGCEVYFLTGTDEHGAKIAQAAAKAGISPKEFTDKIAGEFRNDWNSLDISNDAFIRTTDESHEAGVRFFLSKLHDSGKIYKKKYSGLYCIQCEKYLKDEDLDTNGCCHDHRMKPCVQEEENYFFKLSEYQEELIKRISDPQHPGHISVNPPERRNEILGKLKLGLEDISISRANLEWGIKLPFDASQTAYVWIDALLNYITALSFDKNSDTFKKFWPADLHLMAKDILWFHAVIWPAMLLAAGYELPKKIFAHGFFTIDGQKMSKTIGNVIKPKDLISRFGKEASRYLALSLFPFGADGDIANQSLLDKYNSDLANNLGNLVSRTLTMLQKYLGGKIEDNDENSISPVTKEILEKLSGSGKLLDNLDFTRFFTALQESAGLANRYIENTAPWKMAKNNDPKLQNILLHMVSNLKVIALYINPVMPGTSMTIWRSLGETNDITDAAREFFSKGLESIFMPKPGSNILNPGILFPRLK